MRSELLEKLRCPITAQRLLLADETLEPNAVQQILITEDGTKQYPIRDGILELYLSPTMLTVSGCNGTNSVKHSWIVTQVIRFLLIVFGNSPARIEKDEGKLGP